MLVEVSKNLLPNSALCVLFWQATGLWRHSPWLFPLLSPIISLTNNIQLGRVDEESLLLIFKALITNSRLKRLTISGVGAASADCLMQLKQILTNNFSLTRLHLISRHFYFAEEFDPITYRNRCMEKQHRFARTKVASNENIL